MYTAPTLAATASIWPEHGHGCDAGGCDVLSRSIWHTPSNFTASSAVRVSRRPSHVSSLRARSATTWGWMLCVGYGSGYSELRTPDFYCKNTRVKSMLRAFRELRAEEKQVVTPIYTKSHQVLYVLYVLYVAHYR